MGKWFKLVSVTIKIFLSSCSHSQFFLIIHDIIQDEFIFFICINNQKVSKDFYPFVLSIAVFFPVN